MSFKLVAYRERLFEVDVEFTKLLYKDVALSGTEECICGDCKYFLSLKDIIYPIELRLLFEKLGVNINKEYEVCDMGDHETEYKYNGWFHFVGRIINGEDCNVQLGPNTSTMKLKPVTEVFEVGFTDKVDASFFDKNKYPLVQIEFMVSVPYPIEKYKN